MIGSAIGCSGPLGVFLVLLKISGVMVQFWSPRREPGLDGRRGVLRQEVHRAGCPVSGVLSSRMRRQPVSLLLLMLITMAGARTASLEAREPAAEFLRELKSRGYYSLASEYLDRLAQNASLDASIRETIDFERGEVLVPAAIAERQLSRRQEMLDLAKQAFERFLQEHPQSSQAVLARGRLANVLIEQARLRMLEANRDGTSEAARESLRQQSRDLLKTAAETYGDLQGQLRSQLEAIPEDLDEKKDAAKIRLRDDLRAEYVHARFIVAMAAYERAQSWPKSSDERKAALREAEKSFGEVAKKYRRRVHGISALLFQGRCYQELGDLRKALSFYEELLMLPDNEPVFRPLKTKALRGAMEAWITPEVNDIAKALEKSEAWLDKQRPDERQDEDWTAVKWLLAQAYLAKAKAEENGPKKTEATQDARRWALEVAKLDSPFQSDAQALLADTGQVPVAVTEDAASKMSTFGEALAAAEEALTQRQVLTRTRATLEERLAQLADGAEKEEVRKQVEEASSQLETQDGQARQLLRRAEQLATEETSSEQLNLVRFYQAALYFYEGDYPRAAVISEFLATRYPNSPAGQRAAPVALSALVQLLGNGNESWAQPLRSRIGRTARQIAERDPGRPEVADALGVLVTLALRSGQPEEAEAFTEKLPEDSPKRAAAELAVGQAFWNQAAAAKGKDAETLRGRAVKWLEQGLGRESDEVTASQLTAALLVAQNAVSQGQARRAIEILEQPGRGPKALADENHRLFATGELKQRTFALAITAYISALPEMKDPQEGIAKALATLDQLKTVSQGQGESQRMAATYLSLARNLEQQIKEAPAERRATLVEAFDRFLDRAAEASKELGGLLWVAESYVGLAKAIQDGGGEDPGAMYGKALKTYDEIQQRAKAGQLKLTTQESLLVRSRLAIVYREMGKYSASLDAFAEILADQENQIHVQMEAARTLQAWGDAGELSAYERAIQGDRPDPKTKRNRVWGYGRVARSVASNPELRELFLEARYCLAESRFRWADKQSAAARDKGLKDAEQDIVMTLKLYPGSGASEHRKKYDALLREIKQAIGN